MMADMDSIGRRGGCEGLVQLVSQENLRQRRISFHRNNACGDRGWRSWHCCSPPCPVKVRGICSNIFVDTLAFFSALALLLVADCQMLRSAACIKAPSAGPRPGLPFASGLTTNEGPRRARAVSAVSQVAKRSVLFRGGSPCLALLPQLLLGTTILSGVLVQTTQQ